MPADPDAVPPPDWYVDPTDPAQGRYWDGTGWTDQTVAIPEGLALRPFGPVDPASAAPSLGPVERWMLVGLGVAILAFCLVIAWRVDAERASDGTGSTVAVEGASVAGFRGSLDLEDPRFIGLERGDPCVGEATFDDLTEGLAVTIRASDGSRLAATALGPGRLVPSGSELADDVASLILACRFEFTAEVPVVDRYIVEVDGYDAQSWSRQELEDHEWTARLGVTG